MELVSTVLYFREELCLVFCWKCSRMLTTPLRQQTGGLYQVDRSCVEVLVYIGFPRLRNALPFDFRSRVRRSRERCKGFIVLRQVWRFMLPSKVMPCFLVFEDNQGAAQLAQNPVTNSKSKHIYIRQHFIQELVRQRDIKVVQLPSEFQHADIMTKALAYDLLAFHPKFLMNLM